MLSEKFQEKMRDEHNKNAVYFQLWNHNKSFKNDILLLGITKIRIICALEENMDLSHFIFEGIEESDSYSIKKTNVQTIQDEIAVCTKDEYSTYLFIAIDRCEEVETIAKTHWIKILFLQELISLYIEPEVACDNFPLYLNTIENAYHSIGIYGDNQISKMIKNYLQGNENIQIVEITDEDLKNIDSGYELTVNCEILLVIDWIFTDKMYRLDGKEQLVLFWKNKCNFLFMDWNLDIAETIVPQLLQHHIPVIILFVPEISELRNADKIRKSLTKRFCEYGIENSNRLRNSMHLFKTEYLIEEIETQKYDFKKGYLQMFQNGKHINYREGFRHTPGSDNSASRRMWIFGPCVVRGSLVDDKSTLSSVLQKQAGSDFSVVNKGSNFAQMNLIMREQKYGLQDVVILFTEEKKRYLKLDHCIKINLKEIYDSIDQLEEHITESLLHCDSTVIKKIADFIYQKVMESKRLLNPDVKNNDLIAFVNRNSNMRIPNIKMYEDSLFTEWIQELEKSSFQTGKNGTIIMNCNPFTLGHQYLIEKAARKVDNLYVFIVEEDKSYFKFMDRMNLVKNGVEHLENVRVLPSGKYMISSFTMPGYFNKDELQEAILDANLDLELFLQVAKALKIVVRFVGEEPLDQFTNQYNRFMKEKLPQYGIDVIEVSRKEIDGKPISASDIRKMLKLNDWAEIEKVTPKITLAYLLKKYDSENAYE